MTDLKSIGIGTIILALAFGLPNILYEFNIVFSDMVQLIMQFGIIVIALYYMVGDEY